LNDLFQKSCVVNKLRREVTYLADLRQKPKARIYLGFFSAVTLVAFECQLREQSQFPALRLLIGEFHL
jgi:hypothetical protein